MGEHSVVYGRPAIVAALGLRARAWASRRPGRGVRLELVDLGHAETVSWDDLRSRAREARERWREFAAGRAPFRRPNRDDPAALVKVALGEAALALAGPRLPALELRVASEIPVGSGFGSSAAVAVAVLAAVAGWIAGSAADPARLEPLALAVERCQHGTPSGVDHRTVLAGGILRYEPGDEARLAPLSAGGLLGRLRLFHTGEPAEGTGEVVAAVRRRRELHPEAVAGWLERMEEAVGRFEAELTRRREASDPTLAAVREFERALEALGVVPAAVRERVREIEERGAAAKISGAGSLAGPGAGGLLVYAPPEAGDLEAALAGLERLRAPLGVEGVRHEEAA